MPPRIYTEQTLQPDATVELPSNASTHLLKVLRHTEGEQVILFNGDGFNYHSVISSTGKRAKLCVESKQSGLSPSPLAITLVQGISRGDRMDFSVQKSVELGVQSIQPVFCEKGKVRLNGDRLTKKMQHWQGIIISACEQCGRSDVPQLLNAITLSELLKTKAEHCSLVPAFGEHPSLAAAAHSASGKLSVLIGPESGLSGQEIAQALSANWIACQLGPRVLRTETATMTALAILQHTAGDLR